MIWRRHSHPDDAGRVVHVALPEGYDGSAARYPVIVCLDAQWTFGTACDVALNLGLARLLPRVVVVGLGWQSGAAREVAQLRAQAYSPTEALIPPFVAGTEVLRGGGAAEHLAWITGTVLPELEARYRLLPAPRTLVGHSLSALFGLVCLLEQPEVFSHWLLASPSIWWDDRVVLELERRSAARGTTPAGRLFMSVGSEEEAGDIPMISNARALQRQIEERAHPDLAMTLQILDGELHHSTIPAALSRGLRWLHS